MSKEHNVWMSVSDLMTGLMVIFLFVAIAYIRKEQEHAVNIREYMEVKNNLHGKMVSEFSGDTSRWQMAVGSDLSIKFKNAQTLFPSGSDKLTPEFLSSPEKVDTKRSQQWKKKQKKRRSVQNGAKKRNCR